MASTMMVPQNCSKCGQGKMQGPRYCKGCGETPKEHLHYRCDQCGYQSVGSTAEEGKGSPARQYLTDEKQPGKNLLVN